MAEEKTEKGDTPPQKSAEMLAAEEEVRKLIIVERRRKIAQHRALRIVLQLAKRRITTDFLCNALNFIEVQDWDDAIDERNAEGLCGYVFCVKKPLIAEGSKQRYKICAKTNRVYDMENYRRFCSVWCAKAAQHVRGQISEKPLTERKNARRLDLTFLEDDLDTIETGKTSHTKKEEENQEEEEDEDEEKEEKEEEKEKVKDIHASDTDTQKTRHLPGTRRRIEIEPPEPPACRLTPLEAAKAALRSWITEDTFGWLAGRSLPEVVEVKKVRPRFLRRHKGDEEGQEEEVALPLVDSISQDAIRRRIVGAELDKCLRDILPALQLDMSLVRAPLRQLLCSFAFSAQNIVLRPREWRAASVLLLEMIARREKVVRDALSRNDAATVVSAFAQEEELDLQELLDECALLSID